MKCAMCGKFAKHICCDKCVEHNTIYSCYTCGYIGSDVEIKKGNDYCPECGTQDGDGFGLLEHDSRFTLPN